MHYDVLLDALAWVCPYPLLHAKKKISAMQSGEILKVITKDRSAVIDFKTYASVSGHVLLRHEMKEVVFVFYLKK